MEWMGPEYFTYDKWSAGSLSSFGIETRYNSILENSSIITKYAVGYCQSNKLHFRPKDDCVAVMFWTKKLGYFWTHLTVEEFEKCFPKIKI